MDILEPCPCCGAPVRLRAMIRWTRLVALRSAICLSTRFLIAPDYRTQLEFACPACRGALTFPLDAPTVDE